MSFDPNETLVVIALALKLVRYKTVPAELERLNANTDLDAAVTLVAAPDSKTVLVFLNLESFVISAVVSGALVGQLIESTSNGFKTLAKAISCPAFSKGAPGATKVRAIALFRYLPNLVASVLPREAVTESVVKFRFVEVLPEVPRFFKAVAQVDLDVFPFDRVPRVVKKSLLFTTLKAFLV